MKIPSYYIGIMMLLGWGLALALILFPQIMSKPQENLPKPQAYAKEVLMQGVKQYDSLAYENEALLDEIRSLEDELEYEQRANLEYIRVNFGLRNALNYEQQRVQQTDNRKSRRWDSKNKLWVTE